MWMLQKEAEISEIRSKPKRATLLLHVAEELRVHLLTTSFKQHGVIWPGFVGVNFYCFI
jgi:hypothetical protein